MPRAFAREARRAAFLTPVAARVRRRARDAPTADPVRGEATAPAGGLLSRHSPARGRGAVDPRDADPPRRRAPPARP